LHEWQWRFEDHKFFPDKNLTFDLSTFYHERGAIQFVRKLTRLGLKKT
jgi:hypothetical protein